MQAYTACHWCPTTDKHHDAMCTACSTAFASSPKKAWKEPPALPRMLYHAWGSAPQHGMSSISALTWHHNRRHLLHTTRIEQGNMPAAGTAHTGHSSASEHTGVSVCYTAHWFALKVRQRPCTNGNKLDNTGGLPLCPAEAAPGTSLPQHQAASEITHIHAHVSTRQTQQRPTARPRLASQPLFTQQLLSQPPLCHSTRLVPLLLPRTHEQQGAQASQLGSEPLCMRTHTHTLHCHVNRPRGLRVQRSDSATQTLLPREVRSMPRACPVQASQHHAGPSALSSLTPRLGCAHVC
jgi:hypothetical protein